MIVIKISNKPVRNTSNYVALARVAILSTGYPPMILLAGVAKLSYDVRQTRTLSGTMVARSRDLVGAQDDTSAVLTVLM